MTTYSILGSLEVQFDGTTVSIARPRRRALLAYLILHANDRVDIDQLINALWDSEPPRTARAQIHTAVSALKAALPDALRADLKSENAGYRLNIGAESLDLSVFRHRAAMARADVAAAEFGPAAGRLRSALGLWRGPALANVEAPFVEPARARLEEERFSAYEALADLEMAAGRHAELVPLLTGLSDEYPTRESIVERLALALYRCGRKTDALAVVPTAARHHPAPAWAEGGAQVRIDLDGRWLAPGGLHARTRRGRAGAPAARIGGARDALRRALLRHGAGRAARGT